MSEASTTAVPVPRTPPTSQSRSIFGPVIKHAVQRSQRSGCELRQAKDPRPSHHPIRYTQDKTKHRHNRRRKKQASHLRPNAPIPSITFLSQDSQLSARCRCRCLSLLRQDCICICIQAHSHKIYTHALAYIRAHAHTKLRRRRLISVQPTVADTLTDSLLSPFFLTGKPSGYRLGRVDIGSPSLLSPSCTLHYCPPPALLPSLGSLVFFSLAARCLSLGQTKQAHFLVPCSILPPGQSGSNY